MPLSEGPRSPLEHRRLGMEMSGRSWGGEGRARGSSFLSIFLPDFCQIMHSTFAVKVCPSD